MSQARAVDKAESQIRVLLVDDDPEFAAMAKSFLERSGSFDVVVRADPDGATQVVETSGIDAVVSDHRMPGTSGLELLEEVRETVPDLPFFLLTGYGSEEVASEAISSGVTDYLQKEGGLDQYAILANRIRNAVAKRQAQQSVRENERFLQAVFDGVKNGLAVVNTNLEIIRTNEWLERRAGEPLSGRKCYEAIRGVESVQAGDFCPVREAIDTGERQRLETELTHMNPPFWAEITTDPLPSMNEEKPRVLIQVQDVTDRKRREWQLQKRERLYRTLQEQTEQCIAASSTAEIWQRIVDSVRETLDYERIAVLGFDSKSGRLSVERASPAFEAELGPMATVSPGSGPLWEAFRADQLRIIEAEHLRSAFEQPPAPTTDFVAVPLVGHGLLLVHRAVEVEFPEIDIEVLTLCAANAEAVLGRLRKEGELESATDRVSAQAGRIENLRSYLQAIRRIHEEIAEADTRSAIEETLVTELVETDVIDFAWIGRPESGDGPLTPRAWAGQDGGYLDTLDLSGEASHPPARQAAEHRKPIRIAHIAEQLQESRWAKEALTSGFQSVSAFPIEYGGVLYGVLTVYSSGSGLSDETSEALLADVCALLAAHIRGQHIHVGEAEPPTTEFVFSIADSNHLFYMLSKVTGVPVRFETVLESRNDTIRVVISVPENTDERVLTEAEKLSRVRHATWFGNPADRRVLLVLDPPFIATGVAKHGGQLRAVKADPDGSTVSIGLPAGIEERPIIEWLRRTYQSVELVAKREPETWESPTIGDPLSDLTERQVEVLEAAYVGGYFENPRQISGEDLAESFDISGSAVYKHLRAAEKQLLDQLFESETER